MSENEKKTICIKSAQMYMLNDLPYEEQLKYVNIKKRINELRDEFGKIIQEDFKPYTDIFFKQRNEFKKKLIKEYRDNNNNEKVPYKKIENITYDNFEFPLHFDENEEYIFDELPEK